MSAIKKCRLPLLPEDGARSNFFLREESFMVVVVFAQGVFGCLAPRAEEFGENNNTRVDQ